jgi:hypothetical protein
MFSDVGILNKDLKKKNSIFYPPPAFFLDPKWKRLSKNERGCQMGGKYARVKREDVRQRARTRSKSIYI